ncbi:MAG: hypothetical protein QW607_08045 [Desulfurococcaceae archaeon]
MLKVTGIRLLDDLISPLIRSWIVEFYGDLSLILKVAHYAMAYMSRLGLVYVVFNLEFGGVDTLYIVRVCRMLDCKLNNIIVSRAFRLSDTVNILEDLSKLKNTNIFLVLPYGYLPVDPLRYSNATKITGLIRRISLDNQVIVFNTTSKFGYNKPEGGSLHHHSVNIIVRLSYLRRGLILASLIKHPVKPLSSRVFSEGILNHPIQSLRQNSLLKYLTSSSPITSGGVTIGS